MTRVLSSDAIHALFEACDAGSGILVEGLGTRVPLTCFSLTKRPAYLQLCKQRPSI